ncbi:hypothetical protein HPB49_009735 [Dermacentor silvarum]|uniref:Uncharacterized protein n=1 Tax=Dermacentor silvarum TaxID=543639 RepID=A0ACB8DCC5_DERSI|nr:hypothetical protein HPB49_009735 [Dermacentor silvarum]
MRDSSGFLHRATHGSLHIKQVIIEIPSTWPRRPYATVRQGSGFEGSDVRVYASSDPNVESRPYTIQPRACGEPGDYIHLSSKFLEELNDHTTKEYGNPSYVFIHEWAHLRYGVFDEHGFLGSEKYPALYCDSEGKVRANVCSDKIAFTARTPSGEDCSVCKNNAVPQNCTVEFHQPAGDLVESSIMFMPYVDNLVPMGRDRTNRTRHFKYDSVSNKSICRIENCQHVVSGDHGGNLERHLQRRHKEVYDSLLADKARSTKRVVSDEVEGCPAVKLRQVDIQSMFQPTSSKCVLLEITEDSIMNSCVELVTRNGRPFRLIDDSGFRKIIDPVRRSVLSEPSLQRLLRTRSRNKPNERQEISQTLRKRMFSLKIDCASRLHRTLLGVNVQYAENGS